MGAKRLGLGVFMGVTAIRVLSDYAAELKQHDGRLYLAGLTPELQAQMRRNRSFRLAGVKLFLAPRRQGRSVARSLRSANAWLVRPQEASPSDAEKADEDVPARPTNP